MDNNSKILQEEIDEYLCYDKYLQFVFHCGEDGLVICEPYKDCWIVKYYQNYFEHRTDLADNIDDALRVFKEFCSQAVKDKNLNHKYNKH